MIKYVPPEYDVESNWILSALLHHEQRIKSLDQLSIHQQGSIINDGIYLPHFYIGFFGSYQEASCKDVCCFKILNFIGNQLFFGKHLIHWNYYTFWVNSLYALKILFFRLNNRSSLLKSLYLFHHEYCVCIQMSCIVPYIINFQAPIEWPILVHCRPNKTKTIFKDRKSQVYYEALEQIKDKLGKEDWAKFITKESLEIQDLAIYNLDFED